MTTATELRDWFNRGVAQKAAHMIVVCDTYDWEDFPVYVKHGEDFWAEHARRSGPNMQKIMEVYDLSKPWPERPGRVFDMPPRSATSGEKS